MADVSLSDRIAGVVVVAPDVHRDLRGLFVETYRAEWIPGGRQMVQGNRAERVAGSLVGLHFHRFQADYWYVISGHARVVLHDLRAGGPTDGRTLVLDVGEVGGAHNHLGVYIPPGVAHGFAALTDLTLTYLVDRTYDPADELGLAWDDPAVGADWGVVDPVLSDRDRANPGRDGIAPALRPRWPGAGDRG